MGDVVVAVDIRIRKAKLSEGDILTQISFESKKYWNYPDEYFEVWRDELTLTEEYIRNNIVYVVEQEDQVIGYFSIVYNPRDFSIDDVFVMEGYWLEHIFILPKYIGQGIGSEMIDYAKKVCKDIGCERLYVLSDPNVRTFYFKVGAEYIRESSSNIEERSVALFELKIS